MGVPKAGVELAGRPLIAYPLEAMAAAGLDPVVVAKAASRLPPLDCRVVREPDSEPHPGAGIVAALRAAEGRPVVVAACDMPFVPPGLAAHLAGLDVDAAVPRAGGRLQPLLARYEPSVVPALETAVARAESLRRAVARLEPRILDAVELARFGDLERMTFNVNDRDDLAAAERLMATAPSR